MTSNLGAQALINGMDGSTGEISEEAIEEVNNALRTHFKPEFLNRVDEIIFFKPLRIEEITQIVGLLIKQVAERLAVRHIKLEVTPEAMSVIAKNGYDVVYGARPLKRYLQKNLESKIARMIISGDAPDGSSIKVENQGNDIVINVEELKSKKPNS